MPPDANTQFVHVPQTTEAGPAQETPAGRAERWLAENRAALEDYNRYVAQHGLILGKYSAP